VRLQGESRRRRRGGGAGWIPAGGGAVAPEVGGVGPHPVHLLRLQLLHPFPRLLVLAPAPSLRASFRKGTGHGSNREDRCRTAAPTTGWRPGAASGGQRGVWQVGEGIGRSREVRAGATALHKRNDHDRAGDTRATPLPRHWAPLRPTCH